MQYILGVDCWEGNPHIDEEILKAADVKYMIVRLNNMNGGHHKDTNFDRQWDEAQAFDARWLYFVYNPWVDADENFAWLEANAPEDAYAVSMDVEVLKDGYPASTYAAQVDRFTRKVQARWHTDMYTGGWFLPILEYWPTYVPYWWGRYPYIVYPKGREVWTWEKLKGILAAMTWAPGTAPGPVHNWQITGDRLILPGFGGVCVDINVWPGTHAQLLEFAGGNTPPPPPPPPPAQDLETRVHNLEVWARTEGYNG
jgi:hypothetical protein